MKNSTRLCFAGVDNFVVMRLTKIQFSTPKAQPCQPALIRPLDEATIPFPPLVRCQCLTNVSCVKVDLPKVATATGEENLECLMKIRVKLFRWRDEQWKERGIGNAKLMRDREEKRVRFVMRQEKTLKPVANFISKYISS